MNLNQWRTDGGLIKAAAKLQQNKTFRQTLEVLGNELPTNRTLPAMGANSHDFAYGYGVEVGFRQCMATMEAMAHPIPEVEEVEATFDNK